MPSETDNEHARAGHVVVAATRGRDSAGFEASLSLAKLRGRIAKLRGRIAKHGRLPAEHRGRVMKLPFPMRVKLDENVPHVVLLATPPST